MPNPGLQFRVARPDDAHAVAMLHTDSWQRHYRGAYSDAFLDGEAAEYLDRMWIERLAAPPPQACTILAEDDDVIVGLAHTLLDDDPDWGAFIDNLHVRHTLKRQGIGSRLLALTAQTVFRRSSSWALYLWVLEQNIAAQAFYSARGGSCVERDAVPPPGGDLARLNGRPQGLRFAWRDVPPELPTPN
jgi:GNAT superfamily N-acetyltransferase